MSSAGRSSPLCPPRSPPRRTTRRRSVAQGPPGGDPCPVRRAPDALTHPAGPRGARLPRRACRCGRSPLPRGRAESPHPRRWSAARTAPVSFCPRSISSEQKPSREPCSPPRCHEAANCPAHGSPLSQRISTAAAGGACLTCPPACFPRVLHQIRWTAAPGQPISKRRLRVPAESSGCSVEHLLPKQRVAGSSSAPGPMSGWRGRCGSEGPRLPSCDRRRPGSCDRTLVCVARTDPAATRARYPFSLRFQIPVRDLAQALKAFLGSPTRRSPEPCDPIGAAAWCGVTVSRRLPARMRGRPRGDVVDGA